MNLSATPELSVIIPTHAPPGRRARERRFLRIQRLIQSLLGQKTAFAWDAWIVANLPDPMLKEFVEKLGAPFFYIETGCIGANRARNLGLDHTRGKWILFLDDDCIASNTSFLSLHVEHHRKYPGILAFGGPYDLPEASGQVARAYHRKQMEWIRNVPRPSLHADWLPGGNLSFKRELLQNERFDPTFDFGATETEFELRLAAQGHRMRLIPELSVTHDVGTLRIPDLTKKAFAQGAGGARLLQKGLRPLALPAPASNFARKSQSVHDFLYDHGYRAGERWLRQCPVTQETLRRPGTIHRTVLVTREVLFHLFNYEGIVLLTRTLNIIRCLIDPRIS